MVPVVWSLAILLNLLLFHIRFAFYFSVEPAVLSFWAWSEHLVVRLWIVEETRKGRATWERGGLKESKKREAKRLERVCSSLVLGFQCASLNDSRKLGIKQKRGDQNGDEFKDYVSISSGTGCSVGFPGVNEEQVGFCGIRPPTFLDWVNQHDL